MWFGPFPLLKHFQDCDDSGGQLEWMYPNCSCLFHNYLLTPFEAFRWKVDGSSIVSGITEVKEPQMTIVQVKGALHSGALRLCGMNRMNMCWKKKQCVEMRRVEQTYRNWHCSLLFSDSWPSIASGTQQGTNLIRAISWLFSPRLIYLYRVDILLMLRDIFMNLNSGSPAKFQPSRERHGETWETTFSEFSVLFDLALCSPKWLRWDKAVLEMAPTWFCGACPNHWLIDLVQRSTERQCARQPSLVSSLSSHAGPVTSIPTSSPSKEICGAGRLQVVPSV